MLKFQKYDVIIYDIGADFRILFGVWNSFVMSYPCAKFQHDMTIDNGINCIFTVFRYVYFWTNDRSLSIMPPLSMRSLILWNFFIFKLTLCWSIAVQNFVVISSLIKPPPHKPKYVKNSLVRLGLKMMFCT